MKNYTEITREEARKLSDDELRAALEQKYGLEWSPYDFERGEPLGEEFFGRVVRGTQGKKTKGAESR